MTGYEKKDGFGKIIADFVKDYGKLSNFAF
jgi:hypothetical protein